MSSHGFGRPENDGDYADPFGGAPQQNSMTAPPFNPLNQLTVGKNKKRSSISGGSRNPSFGRPPRNRAPSTSATSDFAKGVARATSIGNASPIAECDDMDIDIEDKTPTTPIRKRSSERTPLEPIMNDLQIDDRRPAPPAFGNSWDGSFRAPRSPKGKGKQTDDDVFGSFGPTSPRSVFGSFDVSLNGGQRRPAFTQPSFGSFQSDATSSFDSLGRPPAFAIPFMDGLDSMRSATTNLTAPSPFGSLKSEHSAFGAPSHPSLMDGPFGVGSVGNLKWTRDEERYLLMMYDKYVGHGRTGVVYLSQSSHEPPRHIAKSVARSAMTFWYIAHSEDSESFGAIDEELRVQGISSREELAEAEWVPSAEEMHWIKSCPQWRHDRKSTQRRLARLVADRFVDKLPNRSLRESIVPVDNASANLETMFSMSSATSAANSNSIPLGSNTVGPSSSTPRRVVNSMGPPSLPVRGEARNVEMQIGMGVRTSVAPSSLPGSFRASGASAADIGRVVKSLRGVPSTLVSGNASSGAMSGHTRQSQSLSAATGNRALDATVTFGPPLSSTKGKKRSREEGADTEFPQRHNSPSPVSRNSEGFDEPRKEDDVFGPPSLRDNRPLNGKRQNRARSHTLMTVASGSSNGASASSGSRDFLGFQPRALVFSPSTVSDAHAPSNTGRGSNHAPSASMDSGLTPARAWSILHGVVEPGTDSIAESARLVGSDYIPLPPSSRPAPRARGSLVGDLRRVTGPITPAQRKADYQFLLEHGFVNDHGELGVETRREIYSGRPLPRGMVVTDIPFLSGIPSANNYESQSLHTHGAAYDQQLVNVSLAALSQSEREARVAAVIADNRAVAASLLDSHNIQPDLSPKKCTGLEGIQML